MKKKLKEEYQPGGSKREARSLTKAVRYMTGSKVSELPANMKHAFLAGRGWTVRRLEYL